MSAQKLAALRREYPNRNGGLRAEEVARELGRGTTRGAVQRVRDGMKRGRYPARKVDGHWQLPLEDLAEILDPEPLATPIIPAVSTSAASSKTGRRRSAIGPRLAFVRSVQFWTQVWRALGYNEEAQDMDDQMKAMRAEGRLARDIERAEEEARRLQRNTPHPIGPGREPIDRI